MGVNSVFLLNVCEILHMFDWEDCRSFLALAETGSLSAAARKLKVDHVTVARRVAALEASLALKLIDRRARATALTDEGLRLAALAQQFVQAEEAVARYVRAASPEIGGEVVISAPPGIATRLIAPCLIELRAAHPP